MNGVWKFYQSSYFHPIHYMTLPGFIWLNVIAAFLFLPKKVHAAPCVDSVSHTITIKTIEGWGPNDSISSVIPFSRAGNLILVKAKADTMEGNFILDTGAPNLVLNITYFRDNPITQHSDGEQGGLDGTSSATLSRTNVTLFKFGSLEYPRQEADLIDLGHIENTKGTRILGLLGMDLFRQCEMIIDYEKGLIFLHRIGKKEASTYQHEMLSETSSYDTYTIEMINNRMIASTELAGKKLKLVIDSGAESNVLDSRLPNRVFEQVTVTRRVVLKGAGNTKVDALYGDVKNMKLGDRELGTLPVLITNLEKSCFSYAGCVDGILGFDFLSPHKIGFNFVKRKMYIWK